VVDGGGAMCQAIREQRRQVEELPMELRRTLRQENREQSAHPS